MSPTVLNPANARMFSMLGQRGSVFGVALPEIADEIPEVQILTADLGLLSGLGKFQNRHPDKYLNLGIAEQNMLGVAAGLAHEGRCVFVTTYATFLSMRGFEFIRHHMGYQGFNIKAIASSAGMAMGMSGNTHYALEDLALMRTVPNLTVLSPADAGEAYKMTHAIARQPGPVYLRLTGGLNCPVVHKAEYELEIGRALTLREGADVALVACGTMVAECLKAAELLAAEGVSSTVVNMHTIKPLDAAAVERVVADHRLVVTVEEHGLAGGLGGAVSEVRAGRREGAPVLRIGLPDAFVKPADHGYLLEHCGLTAAGIVERVKQALETA